ncbi:MAG: hypothetical protein PCFJNLEI_02111 [Verrucomicrobiae bacterium]|nr:hypothetical protein [Verrucomicrobiae bacterium]
MKLGIFSVSLPDYEPLEAAALLKQLGYDGVEWRCTTDTGDKTKPSFWSGNRTTMTAEEIIRRAPELKATGLAMPSLGAYIAIDTCTFAEAELHMRATAAIGAKNVRISAGSYGRQPGKYWDLFKQARANYAQLAELATKHNVRVVIETHMGQLGPSVMKARAILEGLDPRHVGIMWDPANQVYEGSETYKMALDIAGEYLAEVHAKNTRCLPGEIVNGCRQWKKQAAPLREGIVDWPQVIQELKASGYDGWIFFEDFSTDQPLLERLKDNLAWFRELTA